MAIQEQFVNQLTTPDAVNNLVVLPITVAAGYFLVRRDIRGVHEDKEDTARNFGGANAPAFEKVIEDTETHTPATQRAYNVWYRTGDKILTTVGALTLTATLIMHPTIEASVPINNAAEVVVLDSSNSMVYTKDMSNHESRFDASVQAMESMNTTGKFGVVQFGSSAKQSIPLGPKNNSEIAGLYKNIDAVDPNGGDASDGIDQALSELPIKGNNPNEKVGNIVIFSDGTVDQGSQPTNTTVAGEILKAKSEGVDVKVIVPGTSTGQYYTDGTGPYGSAVNPNIYAGFSSKTIVPISNSEALAKSAQLQTASQEATTKQREQWYPPYVLGLGLVVAGNIIKGHRTRKKRS